VAGVCIRRSAPLSFRYQISDHVKQPFGHSPASLPMTEARLGGCGPVVVRAGSHLGGDPDVRTGSDPAGRPPWARLGHRQRPRGSFGVRAPCRVPRRAPQPRHGERRRLSESAATRPPTRLPGSVCVPLARPQAPPHPREPPLGEPQPPPVVPISSLHPNEAGVPAAMAPSRRGLRGAGIPVGCAVLYQVSSDGGHVLRGRRQLKRGRLVSTSVVDLGEASRGWRT
jgi:hypothetical protein